MLFIYLAMIDDDTQRSKFEYIYHTYYGMMYKVAYELTKDQRLAEDAVHETMVNIIEDIDTIRMDNPKELKSYLYLVTKSKTISASEIASLPFRSGGLAAAGSRKGMESVLAL